MFGILLISLGTILSEFADAVGKDQVSKGKQSVYTMGFLTLFFGFLLFVLLAVLKRDAFSFSAASLPTYLLRVALEILQAHVTVLAVTTADRSTFGFLRTLTIPLLLLADVLLGYALSGFQIFGVLVIMTTLLYLLLNHGIARRGAGLVLATALNAVVTISLYKYNITHFNSVVAEQGIMYFILMLYFFAAAWRIAKENPFAFLLRPLPRLQSLSDGAASILESFAYLFAPASVLVTAKRAFAVLWSILSGNFFFREGRLPVKLASFVAMAGGLALLIF